MPAKSVQAYSFVDNFRSFRTSMAGNTQTNISESLKESTKINLALCVSTIIYVFSALRDPNGARNGVVNDGYTYSTSACHDSIVMIQNEFHPQDVFISRPLVWIDGQKTFIQARVM